MNLESTRFGRFMQCLGVLFIALGIGLTVLNIVTGAWLAAPINIITIGGGIYLLLMLGPKAVRQARDHKAFMDGHRARTAEFERADLIRKQAGLN